MGKTTYGIDLLNLGLPFILGKNKKERNPSVKKIPKIRIGQTINGHKVKEVHKNKDHPFSFTCSTCNGHIAHPFDGDKFDVYKKIPPPK